MQIRFSGVQSKRLKSRIREAINICADNFFDKRIKRNLKIQVKMEDLRKYNTLAEVEVLEHETIYPREFLIALNSKQTHFAHILCMMHEMVHVKQFAKAELVESARNSKLSKYKGEWIDTSKVHYYDLPWEVEAHGREKGLVLQYINTAKSLTKLEKKKWRDKLVSRDQ